MSKNDSNSKSNPAIDAAYDRFADMLIRRMVEMEVKQWEKSWINVDVGRPINLSGRAYNSTNALFLMLESAAQGYKYPVFMTFNQVKDEGLMIRKGEESFPVVYSYYSYYLPDGTQIKPEEWEKLPEDIKKDCYEKFNRVVHRVFNLDQTNCAEVRPDIYDKCANIFKNPQLVDCEGMYTNAALDRMFEKQEWLCKINITESNRAFYYPSADSITLPLKKQFGSKVDKNDKEAVYNSGMHFYSTALHEMSHSTGIKSRLDRDGSKNKFGDAKYAKEELVAEFTSAIVGQALGFSSVIADSNISYLDSWSKTLKAEPSFLKSLMGDVSKSATMLLKEVEKQEIALGKVSTMQILSGEKKDYSNSSVYKVREGEYYLRVVVNGDRIGEQKLAKAQYDFYRKLNDSEKNGWIECNAKRYESKLIIKDNLSEKRNYSAKIKL